ncbi:helix-turn-helix domain-containing protein [Ktedonosporobacter rubrisoli]|nr:helix-turn-helix transcriptional regulator [Ktedonosporobacter rubrisoli]
MERAQLSRLEQERLDRGWTRAYVAEKVGVDPATVLRWERGQNLPQPLHRQQLCKLFSKSASALGLEEEESPTIEGGQTSVVPAQRVELIEDTYTVFRSHDFTMRLQTLVWSWLIRYGPARYHELQQLLLFELEDNSMHTDDLLSRREAIRRLACLPIEVCGLSLAAPVLVRPIEEILTHCAAGITACWYLRKGKDLAFASDTISRYIPTLREIVAIGTEKQRQASSSLLAQCYLLLSELAMHVSNSNLSLSAACEAETYSKASGDAILQIVAARRHDAAHWYAGHWEQALQSAQKAQHLLETAHIPISPRIQSYVYAGLASDQAYFGQKEALVSLKKAHSSFFAHSPDEPVPIWISNHSEANLVLNDGLTHFYLGKNREAFDSFKQITEHHADTEVIRVEALINQVMAEITRDDVSRDRDLCISLWQQGIEGAISLRSEQWFNEARISYTAMQAAWPTEPRIKALRELLVHW